jgi:hypothetical protein
VLLRQQELAPRRISHRAGASLRLAQS